MANQNNELTKTNLVSKMINPKHIDRSYFLPVDLNIAKEWNDHYGFDAFDLGIDNFLISHAYCDDNDEWKPTFTLREGLYDLDHTLIQQRIITSLVYLFSRVISDSYVSKEENLNNMVSRVYEIPANLLYMPGENTRGKMKHFPDIISNLFYNKCCLDWFHSELYMKLDQESFTMMSHASVLRLSLGYINPYGWSDAFGGIDSRSPVKYFEHNFPDYISNHTILLEFTLDFGKKLKDQGCDELYNEVKEKLDYTSIAIMLKPKTLELIINGRKGIGEFMSDIAAKRYLNYANNLRKLAEDEVHDYNARLAELIQQSKV